MAETRLLLPRPHARQHEVLADPARFKLKRTGRRWGKSRGKYVAATIGHGPGYDVGRPTYRGMLQGADVLWLGPDYPQVRTIWREEIRPRIAGVPGFTVRESEHRVEMVGGGSLMLRSAENIDSVRGGEFDGVLLDEAAHFDLEYAWSAVIRPSLTKRRGWAMFGSTPNAGHDGNSAKRTPSYFNILCQKIGAGEMGPEWKAWHFRTEDNPHLPPEEVASLRAEYPSDSVTAQQELDALLVAGGLMALTIDRARVLVPAFTRDTLPRWWEFYGAFDWGYSHPFSFGLYGVDGDGHVTRIDGVSGRKLVPSSIVEKVRGLLERYGMTFADLPWTVAGRDAWADSKARGEVVPTIAETCALHGWTLIPATTARVSGLNNMRTYLEGRRFTVCDTPNGRSFLACLESRVTDPNDPEDVLKQDADHDGKGGDDEYDEGRYALAARPIIPSVPKRKSPADYQREVDSGKPWKDRVKGEQVYAYSEAERAATVPSSRGYAVPVAWEEA